MKIGFIGQGWIGKNYADDFEERGYEVIRYSRTQTETKDQIAECEIVFIAVPAPTTPEGFDSSIIEEVLHLVGKGKIAVIKCTLPVGTTERLQSMFMDITVMHSPEFLTEVTAAHDARFPDRNIIGVLNADDPILHAKAVKVMRTLPMAPFQRIVNCEVAEMIKYAGNCWFVFKVLFINTLYDLCADAGVDYSQVKDGMGGDPRIGFTHLDATHKGGRGAGGHCFIKDFAAYIEMCDKHYGSEGSREFGFAALKALEAYNIDLLKGSGKNLDLLEGVYGEQYVKEN